MTEVVATSRTRPKAFNFSKDLSLYARLSIQNVMPGSGKHSFYVLHCSAGSWNRAIGRNDPEGYRCACKRKDTRYGSHQADLGKNSSDCMQFMQLCYVSAFLVHIFVELRSFYPSPPSSSFCSFRLQAHEGSYFKLRSERTESLIHDARKIAQSWQIAPELEQQGDNMSDDPVEFCLQNPEALCCDFVREIQTDCAEYIDSDDDVPPSELCGTQCPRTISGLRTRLPMNATGTACHAVRLENEYVGLECLKSASTENAYCVQTLFDMQLQLNAARVDSQIIGRDINTLCGGGTSSCTLQVRL